LDVVEGQFVHAGDALLIVSGTRTTARSGKDSEATVVANLDQKLAAHRLELELVKQESRAAVEGMQTQIAGLTSEISLSEHEVELELQRSLIKQKEVERVRDLGSKGFFGVSAIQQKEDELIEQQARQASAERNLASLKRQRDDARRTLELTALQSRRSEAQLLSTMSAASAEIAVAEAAQQTVITAPIDGRISGLRTYLGSRIRDEELLSIVPSGTPMVVHFLIPSTEMTHIRKDQVARIRIPALRYQDVRFIDGSIESISYAAVAPSGITDSVFDTQHSSFLGVARLRSSASDEGNFQPGSAVTVELVQETKTINGWIFHAAADFSESLK